MSHSLEMTFSLKLDGQAYPGFPLVRRLQVDEIAPLGFEQDALAGYTALSGVFGSLSVVVLTTDQALLARCNNQSNGSIPINAGGLVVLFDVAIDTSTLLSVLNAGSVNANLNGLLGGT
jgi:hypothetical protein